MSEKWVVHKKIAVKIVMLLGMLMAIQGALPAVAATAVGDKETPTVKSIFQDVSSTDPNYIYINYLNKRDIIKGFPDGSYHPGEGLTRAQAAVVVVKAAGLSPLIPDKSSFKDVSLNHWAAGYINTAVKAGYIYGFPDGTYKPDDKLTRAQGISLVMRLCTQKDTAELPVLKDMDKNHWAAAPMAEALAADMIGLSADKTKAYPDLEMSRGNLSRAVAVLLTKDPGLAKASLKGSLKDIKGQITLVREGKSIDVKEGVSVEAGDTIKTAAKAEANIVYPDGSSSLIGQDTELLIKQSEGRSYIKQDGSPGISVDYLDIDLKQGTLFGSLATRHEFGRLGNQTGIKPVSKLAALDSFRLLAAVGNNQNPAWYKTAEAKKVKVKVDMPWGVAAIRGTFIKVTVNPDGSCHVSCLTGSAEVSGGNGSTVPLGQGQASGIVTQGEAPAQAGGMTKEDKQDFEQVQQWVVDTALQQDVNQEAKVPPPVAEVVVEIPNNQNQTPAEQVQTTVQTVIDALQASGIQLSQQVVQDLKEQIEQLQPQMDQATANQLNSAVAQTPSSSTYTSTSSSSGGGTQTSPSHSNNVTAVPSSAKAITAFSLAEQLDAATIDTTNHTVAITVVYGTTVTNLIPTFTLSDGASAKVGEIAQISQITANDFTNLVTYTVKAADNSTQDWTVAVSVAAYTPVDLVITAKTATTVDLSFSQPINATDITLKQSPAGSATWTDSIANSLSQTSLTVTGLNPGTYYDFKLVVSGGVNNGDSNIVSLRTVAESFPMDLTQTVPGALGAKEENRLAILGSTKPGVREVYGIGLAMSGQGYAPSGYIQITISDGVDVINQYINVSVYNGEDAVNIINTACTEINSHPIVSKYYTATSTGGSFQLTANGEWANRNITLSIGENIPVGIYSSTGTQYVAGVGAGNITVTVNDGIINGGSAVNQVISLPGSTSPSDIANLICNVLNNNIQINGDYIASADNNEVILAAKTARANRAVVLNLTDTDNTGVGNVSGVHTVDGAVPFAEINRLNINQNSNKDCNLKLVFDDSTNHVVMGIVMANGETAEQIATAIQNKFNNAIPDYAVSANGNSILFTRNTADVDRDVTFYSEITNTLPDGSPPAVTNYSVLDSTDQGSIHIQMTVCEPGTVYYCIKTGQQQEPPRYSEIINGLDGFRGSFYTSSGTVDRVIDIANIINSNDPNTLYGIYAVFVDDTGTDSQSVMTAYLGGN